MQRDVFWLCLLIVGSVAEENVTLYHPFYRLSEFSWPTFHGDVELSCRLRGVPTAKAVVIVVKDANVELSERLANSNVRPPSALQTSPHTSTLSSRL